jgi:glucan phosphoethanolaminetransferase (alkaline phosphatase superfamily)
MQRKSRYRLFFCWEEKEMFELVNQYFVPFIAIVFVLLALTVFIRVKSAKTKKDKTIYNVYSVILGLFLVLLVAYKFV